MNHAEAIQTQAAEKYLLGEFSAAQQDEFAEHFLDCKECSNEMRLTSLFVDTTKRVLATDYVQKPRSNAKPWKGQFHSARYAIAASIALLAFIIYQNAMMFPKLRSFSAPQALAYFSIAGMGSRGPSQTVITPVHGKPFLLLLDLPSHENIYEYRCEILGPDGRRVLSIDVPETQAKKTVPLLIPASALSQGNYTFAISGRSKDEASYTQFEKYPFQAM
jgi:hypothetical protein